MHYFTPEEGRFIKDNVKGKGNAELTNLFNKHFGLNLKTSQIKSFKANRGLKSGLDCRFKPGHTPYNKGKKGIGGFVPTQYKKGNRPWNYKPVGSVRVNGEGYIDIKIADPSLWKAKHLLVWEAVNGPVPEGHAVIFGDSNNRNFDLNNLLLVSRKQLLELNRNNLIQNDKELTKVGIIIADIHTKIAERKKAKVV